MAVLETSLLYLYSFCLVLHGNVACSPVWTGQYPDRILTVKVKSWGFFSVKPMW